MRRYVSLASLSLASVLFLLFAGCNKSDNSGAITSGSSSSSSTSSRFVGSWKSETGPEKFRLTEDGKILDAGSGDREVGSYTVTGDKATLTWQGGKKASVTLMSSDRGQYEEGGSNFRNWQRP